MINFITIRDIAMAAGVSPTTVSYALRGKTAGVTIPQTTRARIIAIARQAGYKPNRIARDMVLGRQSTVGLVLSIAEAGASAAMIPELEPVLAAAGYRLVVMVLPLDTVAARDRLVDLLHDGVAGIVSCPAAMPLTIEVVATACPVIPLSPTSSEMLLKALGVPVPVMTHPIPATPTPLPLEGGAPSPPAPNDLCSCGSGKKYKKCHGKWQSAGAIPPITNTQPFITVPSQPDPIPATPTPLPLEGGALSPPAPNDLCPCGSGKKYKKCHGKWGGHG